MSAPTPADTPFRQQRLPAWQPILSPPYVIGCFFLVTVIFIPIGVAILVSSSKIVELSVRYDNYEFGPNKQSCAQILEDQVFNTTPGSFGIPECKHSMEIRVTETLDAPVYLYYELENYQQNHRRYCTSRSDAQLEGTTVSSSDLGTLCDPFTTVSLDWSSRQLNSKNQTTINPCGLIAWSMFNDSFVLYEGNKILCDTMAPDDSCLKDGIAWPSDVNTKFSQSPAYAAEYFSHPFEYENEKGHLVPNTTDQDLMVWMRTATLPTFRKYFRKMSTTLVAGVNYTLVVTQRYRVKSFGGAKSLVWTTSDWVGAKNEFLGIAYLVVGGVTFLFAIAFIIIYLIRRSKAGDIQHKP